MGIRHPNLMNGKQRIEEIASILAVGILRLKNRQKEHNSLDLHVVSSVHVHDEAQRGWHHEKHCIGTACKSANHDE
jgi:hypothetical protein